MSSYRRSGSAKSTPSPGSASSDKKFFGDQKGSYQRSQSYDKYAASSSSTSTDKFQSDKKYTPQSSAAQDKYSSDKSYSQTSTPKDKYSSGSKGLSQASTSKDKYSSDQKYSTQTSVTKDKNQNESKYSSLSPQVSNSKDRYSSDPKYSNQVNSAKDKYSSDQKYSSQTSNTKDKYSVGLQKSASTVSNSSKDKKYDAAKLGNDRNSASIQSTSNKYQTQDKSNKSLSREAYDNEKNAAKDKLYAAQKSTSPGPGPGSGSGSGAQQASRKSESSWKSSPAEKKSTSPFSADADKYGSPSNKYANKAAADDRWASKNFSGGGVGTTFSAQSPFTTWEEKNKDRTFPYDRDHDLRRTQYKYDVDVRTLDAKYRKPVLSSAAGVLGTGAVVAVGTAGGAGTGAAREAEKRLIANAAGPVSELHGPMLDGADTNCHNCSVM